MDVGEEGGLVDGKIQRDGGVAAVNRLEVLNVFARSIVR